MVTVCKNINIKLKDLRVVKENKISLYFHIRHFTIDI